MKKKIGFDVVCYWENQAERIECAWSEGLSWVVALRFGRPIFWKSRVIRFT
jgi:hypothetical protein